jgi:hypothetical protein
MKMLAKRCCWNTAGPEPWQVWLTLDDLFTTLAEPAAERILWQASHPL